MRKLIPFIVLFGISLTNVAQADYTYAVKYATVACPDSMKAMLFAKTGKIRKDMGCQVFMPGVYLTYTGNVQPEIKGDEVIKLSNNRPGKEFFDGYFVGRDIIFIAPN